MKQEATEKQKERYRDEFGRRIDDILISGEYNALSDPNLKIVMVHISYMNMKLNKIELKLEEKCSGCSEVAGLWKVLKVGGACTVALIPVVAAYINNLNSKLTILMQEMAKHTGSIIP